MIEKPVHITVSKIIDSNLAVSTDDGDLVFLEIDNALSSNKSVLLDFSGITIMITAFLNSAIGQLYSKYDSNKLNSSIEFSNVANEDKILFKKVVERAKEYFASKKGFEDTANQTFYGS